MNSAALSSRFPAYAKHVKMSPLIKTEELIEWMEGFLRAYPSMSVKMLIKTFREEINHDFKHRVHLRRMRKGKPNVPDMQRLRFTPFTLYSPLPVSVESTQRESQESVCEGRPAED